MPCFRAMCGKPGVRSSLNDVAVENRDELLLALCCFGIGGIQLESAWKVRAMETLTVAKRCGSWLKIVELFI
jgi:hypothetical protein